MIKTKKIDIFDGLELKEATFKQKVFPTHFHETYSIGIIKKGIENISVSDMNLIATPKSVVIINEYELHSNSYYNNENWSYQTININYDVLKFLNTEINKNRENFVFQNLIEDDYLYKLISNFHLTSNFNTSEQISQISKYLLKKYIVEKNEIKTNYSSSKNIVLELKYLMENNFIKKINIDSFANKHNKTPYQMIRAFKAHIGMTPISYLILIRLNKSKTLLAEGNSIVDTALECGFYDQSYFANCFKKYFGISPKQYSENYSIVQEG